VEIGISDAAGRQEMIAELLESSELGDVDV
jgi:hypothetical protein